MSDSQDPFATPPEIGSEPAAGPPPGDPSQDEINLALISHLGGCGAAVILLAAFVILFFILPPLVIALSWLGLVVPLVVYLLKKDTSAFVESQSKEALNFQITVFFIYLATGVVALATCFIMSPLILLPMVVQFVFGILAVMAVRDGTPYRYPYTLRLIR